MKKILMLLIVLSLTYGCASTPLQLTNNVEKGSYDILGEGEGSATGIMLFDIIPIGQNTRFKDAYQRAVKSKGGDALLNPVITENWFWAYILNGYKTTVKGTVIKYRN
ncbi:MAG: hypothetical protein JRG74_08745 [Deltaproteobacteria bacterium]|jgi:hypothetical protein|nr:hypothetical protein [Deltaproteobacteria bacterium]MBW2166165.1 hypothetical protein [Deltaproteobacteria bacterium]